MADLGKTMRETWIKSMEAISTAARGLANNTRYKVEELNLQSRRRELLNGFGATAYELWQKGERFPEEAEKLLRELDDLDAALKALEAEKMKNANTPEEKSAGAEEEADSVSCVAPGTAGDAPAEEYVPDAEDPQEDDAKEDETIE